MKMIYDFFPVFLFFFAYRFYGIYMATVAAMGAAFIQLVLYRAQHQRYEKMHMISFFVILILGGATLFFHNPWFIKWKPTVVYWIMSIALLGSQWLGKQTLLQRMIGSNIHLPSVIWRRLNKIWGGYFALLGVLNIYVAYTFSTDVWVNFKLFGGIGLTLLFVLGQALYLTKHVRA